MATMLHPNLKKGKKMAASKVATQVIYKKGTAFLGLPDSWGIEVREWKSDASSGYSEMREYVVTWTITSNRPINHAIDHPFMAQLDQGCDAGLVSRNNNTVFQQLYEVDFHSLSFGPDREGAIEKAVDIARDLG